MPSLQDSFQTSATPRPGLYQRDLSALFFCIVFVLVGSFCPGYGESKNPLALYLSWAHDPTTTMTIQWHTLKKNKSTEVSYRQEGGGTWQRQTGSSERLFRSSSLVHTVELRNLEPGTDYLFRIEPSSRPYRFRTLPKTINTEKPLRFVIGGDVYYFFSLFKKMNTSIAKMNPDFIIVGGDIAYTYQNKTLFKGRNWEINRWQTFLKQWKRQMVTQDGRLIPILPVLGNHDIRSAVKNSNSIEAPFYQLFAMPEPKKAYRALDISNYLSLILLDTAHHHTIEGPQAHWLARTLSERSSTPFKIAAYHVAAYPSRYNYDETRSTRIRETWVPLFEQYGVQAAFEHHNHTFKRTHPLKAGKVDPSGILYLGDGSWGVAPRVPIRASKTWYLAKAQKTNCFWLASLSPEKCSLQAFNLKGKRIDQVSIFPLHP
jgi:acid phosphatase type 7